MTCNRPDAGEWWRNSQQNEDWRLWGIGDTFSTWCNKHLDRELPGRCTVWGEDLERYYPALVAKGVWGDINFEANGWEKAHCSSGDSGRCTMKRPKEHNKYACCTNGKNSVLQCGQNWCKEDASNCDTYMGQYCSAGTRLIDDANCYAKFQLTKATEINELCKQPTNIMKTTCRDFCTNQLANKGPFIGTCHKAAEDYCAIPANAAGPDCKCVNYRQTSEYKSLLKKLGTGETGIPDPQCWAEPCKTGKPLMSTSDCPTSMALCIQSLEASGVNSQNVGTIGSACNINLQNSSSTSSSPTPPRTTAPPPPRTTAPPPPTYGTPPPPRVPPQNESLSPGAIIVIIIIAVLVGLLAFK
jgi:hypothetical protein